MKQTPAQRLRQNPDYYLNELRINAERSRAFNYYEKNPNRKIQIESLRKKYQHTTGAGRKRRLWSEEEMTFLKQNCRTMRALDMAVLLNRSWMSIQHKLNRLKLRKYNDWKAVKI